MQRIKGLLVGFDVPSSFWLGQEIFVFQALFRRVERMLVRWAVKHTKTKVRCFAIVFSKMFKLLFKQMTSFVR